MDADNGRPQNFELHIEEDINGRRSSQRYWLTNGPYGQALSITRLPSAIFNDGNVDKVVVNTPTGTGSITEIWIRVKPLPTGGTVHFWFVNSMGGVVEHPTVSAPSFTSDSVSEELESRYEAMVLPGILARKGIVSGAQGQVGGAIRARLWIKGNQPEGGDTARIALLETASGTSILDVQSDGVRVSGGGIDVLAGSNYYAAGVQVMTVRQSGPGSASGGASTTVANDSPDNADTSASYSGSDSINRSLLETNIHNLGAKANAHALKLNAQADAYNTLAGKYNDLAGKFNNLVAALQTHGLIG
jgi:hypothetical protein